MGVTPTYGQISQSDHDDDRHNRSSPSMSLSPAASASPMPSHPAVDTTFTPLSMDSEFGSESGKRGDNLIDSRHSRDRAAGPDSATATANATISIGKMVQSLSSARATNSTEYDVLSPSDTPSPASSSPNLDNTNPGPGPGHFGAQANFVSRETHHQPPNSTIYGHPDPVLPVEASSRRESASQPILHQPTVIRPKPIVRTASTKSVALRHPTPDINKRSSSHASNIAQLEATAEQLSMTSSIDDAIRDLHDEQKRNESRRSSILAASIGSIPETSEPVTFPISRQISGTSSILETNSTARHGGYSPFGYVMSPNHSLHSNSARLRSGSTGFARPEPEVDNMLSRHGPGKNSVRSVRSSGKPALTDIVEMEPTALTSAAMDEADRLAEEPEEEAIHIPQLHDVDLTPYGDQNAHDYWGEAVAATHPNHDHHYDDRPPPSPGSTGTYDQAERAFADFDGAHCSPDADLEDALNFQSLFASPTTESFLLSPPGPEQLMDGGQEPDPSRPVISRPIGLPTARPKSYLDPDTGDTMMYYPARVPMMLNLPQKLSKKPKADVRNKRRSEVLNAMPEANRQSVASWLPEFIPEPLLGPIGSNLELSTPLQTAPSVHERSDSQFQLRPHPRPLDEEARKSRISVLDSDKRKSRMSTLDALPPQLRASAFFDLPSESPAIQLKDGSAMATLDSILDASAKAPVSAFTDHAFAGSLGTEVYGAQKKRKSYMKRSSAADLSVTKKRSSFFHLRKPSALSGHSNSQDERQNTITGHTSARSTRRSEEQDGERQHLAGAIDGEPVPDAEDDEEEEEEEEEGGESGDDLAYHGPPTTLLAELQIRKQQQKLRTRPVASAYPNGLHSTLLELDTVAELESKARKGKKVNLAWEGPGTDAANESDDEDMPLGLLMAAKGQNNDMVAAMAEINRPLGLMERREMEDNEPLTARRNRLQGRDAGPIKRQSMLSLGQGPSMSGGLGPSSPGIRVHTPEDDEVEGETLGERMRRLRTHGEADNPLPRARPVSSAFSLELLSQLGDTFKEKEPEDKGKDSPKSPPKEEEETLGQRRRRLQAEREARDREMAGVMLPGDGISVSPKLTKRHSLADVLGARSSRTVLSDPRVEAERARQEEAALYRHDQGQKMAALRSQMPSNLVGPNVNRSGGYLSGRFNDGTGGGLGQPRASTAMSGYGTGQGMGMSGGMPNHGMTAGMVNNGYPMAPAVGGVMSTYGMPMGYTAPMPNAYTMPMQMPIRPPGQMDRVERWRQSIHP